MPFYVGLNFSVNQSRAFNLIRSVSPIPWRMLWRSSSCKNGIVPFHRWSSSEPGPLIMSPISHPDSHRSSPPRDAFRIPFSLEFPLVYYLLSTFACRFLPQHTVFMRHAIEWTRSFAPALEDQIPLMPVCFWKEFQNPSFRSVTWPSLWVIRKSTVVMGSTKVSERSSAPAIPLFILF